MRFGLPWNVAIKRPRLRWLSLLAIAAWLVWQLFFARHVLVAPAVASGQSTPMRHTARSLNSRSDLALYGKSVAGEPVVHRHVTASTPVTGAKTEASAVSGQLAASARVVVAASSPVAETRAPVASSAPAASVMASDALGRVANLFATPPPPPPPPQPVPVPVAPPMAPPLPFTLESVWQVDQQRMLTLRMNGELLIVCDQCQQPGAIHPQQIIGGSYRLLGMNDYAVEFLYLPLKQRQQLFLNTGSME